MEFINATKKFQLKNKTIDALDNINIKFEKEKFNIIMGHSGSGKSTLIQIMGLLDTLSSGIYKMNDIDVSSLNADALADLRMKKIGFVFQSFYLNQNLNALENIMLPMHLNKSIVNKKEKAIELLKAVNMENRANHYPKELSGGEQQRVAIARALANDPEIILADEPTGNLDKKNEKIIYELLRTITNQGKTVIVVSHNEKIISYGDVLYEMENGSIIKC